MHGLDVGTDLSALVGLSLESIDLTQFQLQLRFDSLRGFQVSIEGDFSLTGADGSVQRFYRPAAAAQTLADHLGVEIADARVESPGTLQLRWADGSVLQAYDSNQDHESYQISLGERLIVV